MRITEKQKEVLDSFICERLSSNSENVSLMKAFKSELGESLVEYCNKWGFDQDASGEIAYYIIKTDNDIPLMFFSIKCGALFEIIDEDGIAESKQNLLVLLQAIINVSKSDEEAENAVALLVNNGIQDLDAARSVIENFKRKKTYLRMINDDKEKESNENIYRVYQTHSGVELVHFCTNDDAKELWNSYKLNHTMGETLFWYYIAPKFLEAQNVVGCRYAYLFAADLSEEGTLINYYDVSLKFKSKLDIGTNKPFYDFGCVFLCQEINSMRNSRTRFLESFNIDSEEEFI